MFTLCIVAILAFSGVVNAGKRCSGTPPKYNGKLCASTTRYNDYHRGACGCGPDGGDSQFGWNHDHYVTAPNQKFFDNSHNTWCGSRCGRCVKLTTTGGYIDGRGGPTPEGRSKVFMVTNDCPDVAPNLDWCAQRGSPYDPNSKNSFGYPAHFDLENGAGQISSIGWNNPEVTWEEVNCDQGDYKTPSNSMYSQCFCSHAGRKRHSLNNTTFN